MCNVHPSLVYIVLAQTLCWLRREYHSSIIVDVIVIIKSISIKICIIHPDIHTMNQFTRPICDTFSMNYFLFEHSRHGWSIMAITICVWIFFGCMFLCTLHAVDKFRATFSSNTFIIENLFDLEKFAILFFVYILLFFFGVKLWLFSLENRN